MSFKVGIVGLSRGTGYVRVFSGHPEVRVTALCDLDEQVLSKTGEAFGLREDALFTDYYSFIDKDFDIVVISTPIPFHTEHTIAALENGKHVLCEQTVAYTIPECERVIDAVRKCHKIYMMAENYCYYHFIQEWKTIVEKGRIGKVVYAEAEYLHNIENLLFDRQSGRRFWRHERYPMWYCAHVVGPLLYLTNDRIVRATGCHTGFQRWPDKEGQPGFIDMEVALFQTKNGALIKALRSQVVVRPHLVFYSIYGTKGSMENSRFGVHLPEEPGILYIEDEMEKDERNALKTPCSLSNPAAPEEAKLGGHGTSEYFLIREFLDAVRHDRQPSIDVIRAVEFTVPGIIANESAERGGVWLDVPQYSW
jgi:predicted dehydrogenase